MQLQFGLCLNLESQWGWSWIYYHHHHHHHHHYYYYYYYYFLSGIMSTRVMACELFQHSLCRISVTRCQHWQISSGDEQTCINKGQNCQQEECPVACEDLLPNSIWKAKSSSRTEPKTPGQARDFLEWFRNKCLV